MTAFSNELLALVQMQAQAKPGSTDGPYSMPWYLVLGSPGSGRSTAIRSLNLSWPRGDNPLPMGGGQPLCSYWMPEKAIFIEPTARVVGPSRQQGLLTELAEDLKAARPREPIDGIVLVVNTQIIADSTEDGVDDYAKALRKELIEVNQTLGTDVPVYIVVSGYDALWGFGDAFRWNADRRDEGSWGFALPLGTTIKEAPARVKQELEGLAARIESMCFAKLSSEDNPAERTRAFQHLSEARNVLTKLGAFLHLVTMDNAYERAPWVRALAIGSGVPSTGQHLRHNAQRFASMGLQLPTQSGTPTPGGMPLHGLIDAVLIPERDLVPTRVRWRDDKLLLILVMLAAVLWLGIVIVYFAR
jgi:type VI protein secretion system component VasK